MYWPGWWRHTELAQGHVAGSIFSCFFLRQKKWASYEALSQHRAINQLRGTEPATRECWTCTGPMDFPMQPLQFQQIKLLINSGTIWDKIEDWQSIHMYRLAVYTYVYVYNPNRIILVNLRQHQFSWGRRVPLSWREIGKSNFRV